MSSLRRLVLGLALAAGPPAAVVGQERPPTAEPTIPELIRQLGVDKFREREAAQRALLARDGVFKPLLQALQTLNPEGQRRARSILEANGQRQTNRFVRYAKDGRIDLLVEWSASAGEWIKSERLWQGIVDVGWEIVGRSLSDYDVRTWEQRQFPPLSRTAGNVKILVGIPT